MFWAQNIFTQVLFSNQNNYKKICVTLIYTGCILIHQNKYEPTHV